MIQSPTPSKRPNFVSAGPPTFGNMSTDNRLVDGLLPPIDGTGNPTGRSSRLCARGKTASPGMKASLPSLISTWPSRSSTPWKGVLRRITPLQRTTMALINISNTQMKRRCSEKAQPLIKSVVRHSSSRRAVEAWWRAHSNISCRLPGRAEFREARVSRSPAAPSTCRWRVRFGQSPTATTSSSADALMNSTLHQGTNDGPSTPQHLFKSSPHGHALARAASMAPPRRPPEPHAAAPPDDPYSIPASVRPGRLG